MNVRTRHTICFHVRARRKRSRIDASNVGMAMSPRRITYVCRRTRARDRIIVRLVISMCTHIRRVIRIVRNINTRTLTRIRTRLPITIDHNVIIHGAVLLARIIVL